MTIRSCLGVLLVLVVVGCARDDDAAPGDMAADAVAAENTPFDASGAVDTSAMTRSPTGLLMLDLEEGEGTPAEAGSTVLVHYTGWLMDGTRFDSSHDRGEPFEVWLGQNRVIAGWEEGLKGMRPGGQRRLVVPPELAYRAEGYGALIPPDARLVFDIEMVEVR